MPRKRSAEFIGQPPEAVRAFQLHRGAAKQRGIPFLFTFREWWEWWQTDDRWSRRGRGADKLVMARYGDQGAYQSGNVYCTTSRQNLSDVSFERRSLALKAAWVRNRETMGHSFQTGENHPRSRPVLTPNARYASVKATAEHFGITHGCVRQRIQRGYPGWKYEDQDWYR